MVGVTLGAILLALMIAFAVGFIFGDGPVFSLEFWSILEQLNALRLRTLAARDRKK